MRRHRPWRWGGWGLGYLVGARACVLRSTHSRLLGVALRPPVALGLLLLEVFAGEQQLLTTTVGSRWLPGGLRLSVRGCVVGLLSLVGVLLLTRHAG
ncbi:hypothetical protein VB757_13850 [Synechococcus sp. BA-132 BA5]|nr:hypothetical protein [Synechococcus sp. BA-132 BA5]